MLLAQQGGIAVAYVPLVMMSMNVVYSGSTYSFGSPSDCTNHGTLLSRWRMVLIAAELILAATDHRLTVVIGALSRGVIWE
ncbi:hypothetical protein [Desulfosoma caldarium]|uniref:hypothetical protein n=1 Tax=Desulfosoma caldarium TaxID=610254 RepID=UPI000F481457|nr:hypothetical protein [Desulfosoma caldarium]